MLLKKAAEAYKNAELYYKEFKCLRTLIENAPEQINFKQTVEREYNIANLYFDGYREIPYTWMPWIEDDNHAIEIYEAVLKQSPYAEFIPQLLTKLGYLYLEDGENTKAEDTYKKIIDEYPQKKETVTAYLDLAYLYLKLSERGDGDGYYTKNAQKTLLQFINKYPDAPEIKWAKESLQRTYEMGAERIYKLADFYYDKGNIKTTKRYIRDILVNYPETKTAVKAEELLNSLEEPLYKETSDEEQNKEKKEESKYKTKTFPSISKENLIIPANSEYKWLRPIVEEPTRKDNLLEQEYKNKI